MTKKHASVKRDPYLIGDTMSDATFRKMSLFIQERLGIKMPPAKKTMLQARLLKRMRKLGIGTYDEYCTYLFSQSGMQDEFYQMVNVVTTNKTDFFREPGHFEYLKETVLPEILRNKKPGEKRPIQVWSAGCSTGEEVYSLAFLLAEFSRFNAGFDFSVLGTDISTKVLQEAAHGVYGEEKVDSVPDQMKKRYLLRSRDRSKGLVRISEAMRSKVHFQYLNFMDAKYSLNRTMDIVFCRNVLIYFDREVQQRVLSRICRHIRQGGWLFIGHSETLTGLLLPLKQAIPTIYIKSATPGGNHGIGRLKFT